MTTTQEGSGEGVDAARRAVSVPGEEWCPVTATMTVLGRKWTGPVIDRLSDEGPLGFADLQRAIGGVSAKVLSETLSDMAEKGLVERRDRQEGRSRVAYELTPLGASAEPVVEAVRAWGQTHLEPADSPETADA